MPGTLSHVDIQLLSSAVRRSSGRWPTARQLAALRTWAQHRPGDWAAHARHLDALQRVLHAGASIRVTEDGHVIVDAR
jgi:hypothetical protein